MLGEDTNSELSVNESVTIQVFNLTNESFDKCWFSNTIWTDQSDSSLHINIDVNFPEKRHVFGPSNLTLIESQDRWGDFLWIWEHEDTSRVLHDLIYKLNPIDSFNSRLDQCSSLGIVSELINEFLEVSNLCLLWLPFTSLLLDLLSLRLFELVKVTFVVVKFLALKLDNLVNNLVQEITGMGNDDDSDVEVSHILLEPDKGDKIKMIGRLIEK